MVEDQIIVNNLPIRVRRKPIRHFYIRILIPSGDVLASVPEWYTPRNLRDMIKLKFDWIEQKRNEVLASTPTVPADDLNQVSVWGEMLPVHFECGKTDLAVRDGKLVVTMPKYPNADQLAAIVRAWRRQEVLQKAPAILEHWRQKMNLPQISLDVRSMKKRWGSCYPNNNKIILSSQLAARQPICLAAVIVHELIHFSIPNHSRAFYNELDRWLPNWREIDELLK